MATATGMGYSKASRESWCTCGGNGRPCGASGAAVGAAPAEGIRARAVATTCWNPPGCSSGSRTVPVGQGGLRCVSAAVAVAAEKNCHLRRSQLQLGGPEDWVKPWQVPVRPEIPWANFFVASARQQEMSSHRRRPQVLRAWNRHPRPPRSCHPRPPQGRSEMTGVRNRLHRLRGCLHGSDSPPPPARGPQ